MHKLSSACVLALATRQMVLVMSLRLQTAGVQKCPKSEVLAL
jgi:hypothetical protein